jgi:hypothetical protein
MTLGDLQRNVNIHDDARRDHPLANGTVALAPAATGSYGVLESAANFGEVIADPERLRRLVGAVYSCSFGTDRQG